MQMKKLGLAAVATIIVGLSPSEASATTNFFTDKAAFQAILTAPTTETFNSISPGFFGGGGFGPGVVASGNYTINSSGFLFATNSSYGTGINIAAQQSSPTVIDVTLSSPKYAFGFDYFSTTAVSFLFGSTSFAAPSTPTFPVFGFVGFVSDTPFTSVQFSTPGDGIDFDNFISGTAPPAVPEPGTWMTMLVGFGMMGAAMRYRRRGTKVAFV